MSPSPTANEPRNCYLDTLPDVILRIVLRYSSGRPQHNNWHGHISADSVNTALDVGGALGRAASLIFNGIGGKNGFPLDPCLDVTIIRPLVHRLPLLKLELQLPGRLVWICTPKGMIREFRGVNLLSQLLPGCGAGLRELVLDTERIVVMENDILAISTHCTKLSSLAIRGRRIEGVFAPIWRSLGRTLARIYIGRYYSVFGERDLNVISVPDLAQHCVNLHRVDMKKLGGETTGMMVALGSRVRVLSIEDPSHRMNTCWRQVFGACTSLKAIHSALYDSAVAPDVFSSMRTKLVSMTLHHSMPGDNQFYFSLSTYTVLKKVELNGCQLPLETLRKLFEGFKSVTTFTYVEGSSYYGYSRSKNIIDAMACNLRNIESFTISTREPLNGVDVYSLVGLAHLKSVKLQRQSNESSWKLLENCAVEVVKRLKDCAQLVQLEIDGNNMKDRSTLIAEAAVMYNRKDFDMFIGNYQYRTW